MYIICIIICQSSYITTISIHYVYLKVSISIAGKGYLFTIR